MYHTKISRVNNPILPKDIRIKFNDICIKPYINVSLYSYLLNVKSKINNTLVNWDTLKKYTNTYEFIHSNIYGENYSISKYKPISRSFFKLIEIIKQFKLLNRYSDPIKSFHLAEGPGGFIEAMIYKRTNSLDKYYGMTLIDNSNKNIPGWKKIRNFMNKYNHNIILEKGIDGTGNLFSPSNLLYCCEKYMNQFDIITGDGGFDFSVDFNRQEECALKLIFTQMAYAICLQKKGGHLVLKIFDTFLKPTCDIIYILSSLYENVHIIKPNTSRYANSERYLVCKGFKLESSQDYAIRFISILHIIENIDFNVYSFKQFITPDIPLLHKNQIILFNAIFGQRQIENILNTLYLNNKQKEYIEKIKETNISKCIKWCEKHDIPHIKKYAKQNIFLK